MSAAELTLANHSCHAIINRAQGTPIVFLHGYSFSSNVWQRTSVIELLKEKRIPFIALDMPYGAKSRCQPRTRNVESNVAVIKEALQSVFGPVLPVLVGASIGGHIAVQYSSLFPVKALLLLAPVRLREERLKQSYSSFKFPVRIIIGSEDRVASLEELQEVAAKLPDAELVVYEKAGHAAYLERSDRFKQDLLELYNLAGRQPRV